MKLNIQVIDRIVGIFILVAVLGLVVILIFLGLNQRWFRKNYYFHSLFKSASNLSSGMPITLSGIPIGKVDKITLNPGEKNVRVDFYIYDKYYDNTVFTHSIIELVSSPIGLGSGLVFHPGKDRAQLIQEGNLIPSYNSNLGLEYVNKNLVDRAPTDDSIGALIAQVNPILQQIPPILYAARNVMVELEEAIQGDRDSQLGKTLGDLDTLVLTVNKTLFDLDAILTGRDKGPVGTTLANLGEASGEATTIARNINEVIREVDITVKQERAKLEGMIAGLQNIIDNVDQITADPSGLAVTLLDPRGSLKTFLDDDNQLFDNVQGMLQDVEAAIAELKNFAQFVTSTSPQIAGILDEGKATLDLSQDVLEGLKNNPLLRGGITERREQNSTTGSYREAQF